MLQHQMAVLTQHIRQFQGQEYMSPQQATQMALNAQVVQNAARQMSGAGSGGALVAAASSLTTSHGPPVLHVTQYKNTEMPQPSAKKLTMVEILKKAQDFQLLGSESRPESRNDSRASRAFTPTGTSPTGDKSEKACEKSVCEKSATAGGSSGTDRPRTAISLAKSSRTRIDADVFVKNLCEIAREDDGRMLVHGGEIPKYIWPLDSDGEPYEG